MTVPSLPVEGVSTGVVLLLFAVWLGLTALNSTNRGYVQLRRLGPLHDLIPKWNFFAPRPGTHDYYLLYRDQHVDGSFGRWREAPGLDRSPSWYAAVWNPNKFVPKALFDLVQDLIMQSAAVADAASSPEPTAAADSRPSAGREREMDRHGFLDPAASRSLQITMPYIVLLNYVSKLPRSELSVATQFAVVQRSEYEATAEPVFVSDVHELDR
jgi:hypothetical protein